VRAGGAETVGGTVEEDEPKRESVGVGGVGDTVGEGGVRVGEDVAKRASYELSPSSLRLFVCQKTHHGLRLEALRLEGGRLGRVASGRRLLLLLLLLLLLPGLRGIRGGGGLLLWRTTTVASLWVAPHAPPAAAGGVLAPTPRSHPWLGAPGRRHAVAVRSPTHRRAARAGGIACREL
jgi:hypothetical protein